MKNFAKTIIISSISCFIVLYLAGSFTAASFNIQNWSADSRGTIATIWAVVSIAFIYAAALR